MPNDYISQVNIDGTTYDVKDEISGYTTNTGTVTSVAINGTAPISASGTITTSGTLTVSHAESGVTAQSTQAVYPFKVNATGHITAVGAAVTIPTVNNGALKLQKNSGTASSIYTANQSTDSTIKFTTTSVGSASGWDAGSTPTLGTAITADDITSWTTNTPTTIDTTKFSGGSFTRGTFSGGSFTQGTDTFTSNTPTAISYSTSGTGTLASPGTLIVSVTNGTAASFVQGTDSFTAATHANDTFTAAALNSGFYSAGVAASLSYTSRSIPNVTNVGAAPSLTVTSTTVVNDITTA